MLGHSVTDEKFSPTCSLHSNIRTLLKMYGLWRNAYNLIE